MRTRILFDAVPIRFVTGTDETVILRSGSHGVEVKTCGPSRGCIGQHAAPANYWITTIDVTDGGAAEHYYAFLDYMVSTTFETLIRVPGIGSSRAAKVMNRCASRRDVVDLVTAITTGDVSSLKTTLTGSGVGPKLIAAICGQRTLFATILEGRYDSL
jgi:Holliday junction resolvasome RuvABC DNA-binding subunit